MLPLWVLFFRKRTVFQWVPAPLALMSALSSWQFETPYWQIRKTHFPFSIFLISQSVLLYSVPRVSSRLSFEDVTSHLNVKKEK